MAAVGPVMSVVLVCDILEDAQKVRLRSWKIQRILAMHSESW